MIEHYYNDIQGWFDEAFRKLYHDAVKDGTTFVELGCWKGKSLSYLLTEAANRGVDMLVTGIDHFAGSVDEPSLIHECQSIDIEKVCHENLQKAGYPYTLLRKSSPEAARDFEDGSIDFVFIDASHDYASVTSDIKAWLPKVKPGGILAGHDFGYSGVNAAVKKLLPGFDESGSCWVYKVPMPRRVGDEVWDHIGMTKTIVEEVKKDTPKAKVKK